MRWNQKLKTILPNNVIQSVRNVVESFECLWRRNYYGQFGEDAVLQNVFREMAWRQAGKNTDKKFTNHIGFYVDVGAFAPIQHSNTYWFYKRGWKGINIDAAPGSMRVFKKVRPRDVNLETAISSQECKMTYYCWGIPNVMNTTSKETADQITRQGGSRPQEISIQARTLEQVLDENLLTGQVIDFLTVDVENHNFEVIKSNNWNKYKPRIVLVETDGDCSTIEEIINSKMTAFMNIHGYKMRAWIRPTLVFALETIEDSESTAMDEVA